MVKSVLFHLGDPKTGSTSIQHVLATGAYRIPGQSLAYTARTNHIGLAKTLGPDAGKRDARWGALAEALEDSPADLGIVSAEYFASVDPADLDAALRRYMPRHRRSVRLIAYVRPHAERLVSAFAERRKVGMFDGSMDRLHEVLLKEGTLLYAPRFAKWREVFGEAFTLRPMIRDELVQHDVVEDFFTWAVGAGAYEITDKSVRNEALSCAELAAMVELHRSMRDFDRKGGPDLRAMRQAFGVNFGRLLSDLDGRTIDRPRLHRALAERLVETYREDAAALDDAFFAESRPLSRALRAAPDKALDAAQPTEAEAYFGPEARHVFAATGQMLQNFLAADPNRFLSAVRGRVPEHPRKIGTLENGRDGQTHRGQTETGRKGKGGKGKGGKTGRAGARRIEAPQPSSAPQPSALRRLGRRLPYGLKRRVKTLLRKTRR